MCVCELNDGHNKNDNTIDTFLIFMHFHHPLFSLYACVCVCVYIAVCIHIHIFCSRDRCALNFSSITIIFFIHHYFICNVRFEYMCIMGLLILFCFHSGIFHPTQLLVRSFVVAFTLFLFDSFLVSLPL